MVNNLCNLFTQAIKRCIVGLPKGELMKQNGFYTWVGNQLRQYRKMKGLSLQEVANIIGGTKKTMGNYENANTKVPFDTMKKLCDLYELDFDKIVEEAKQYI